MDSQRLMNEILCHLKAAGSDLEEDRFEMSLPLCLCDSLGMLHDLSCSLWLAAHLKVFGVLKHGHGHLLRWNLVTASFDDLS